MVKNLIGNQNAGFTIIGQELDSQNTGKVIAIRLLPQIASGALSTEYVTWGTNAITGSQAYFGGHYFDTFQQAVADFAQRRLGS